MMLKLQLGLAESPGKLRAFHIDQGLHGITVQSVGQE